jgi:hypothetical protein
MRTAGAAPRPPRRPQGGTVRWRNRSLAEPFAPLPRPPGMSARHHFPVQAVVLLAMVVLGACSSIASSSLLPVATGPLVSVTTRGGECIDGPCGSTVVIDRDGTVHQALPTEAELGEVPADVLTALDAAIKTTDFDVIRAVPFDGECPVNFDGQEFVYEFGSPGGVERVASCETAIDPAHPVFAATTAALVAVEVIPAP